MTNDKNQLIQVKNLKKYYNKGAIKAATYSIGEPLIVATVIYFCLTFPTSKIIQHFERKMSRGDKR